MLSLTLEQSRVWPASNISIPGQLRVNVKSHTNLDLAMDRFVSANAPPPPTHPILIQKIIMVKDPQLAMDSFATVNSPSNSHSVNSDLHGEGA